VAKYWNEHIKQTNLLGEERENISVLQEEIVSIPSYDSTKRKPRKYNEVMDKKLDEILMGEDNKNKVLGASNKQKLTRTQIHHKLTESGFDISYCTISNKINEKVAKHKECFIKQTYEYGDRLEYDFGEVKLVIDGTIDTYYMAVISSPGSNFRWAFLYRNQQKSVFMDSHVKFFEMIGGVYREVVYDNMRNVVTKFIGRNEKELNEDLLKMSIYYGFDINVTNCFSGNEKGHVEGSVKIIRNQVFAPMYEFVSFEDAQTYLHSQLLKMNEKSAIDVEKQNLLPYKPKLELASISLNNVNKYSFIQVDNNFYSVPEYLVGKQVTVKLYFDRLLIYSNNSFVYEHKRLNDSGEINININHYLETFRRKPGAIRNSLALKSIPSLKMVYDKYFNSQPKKFLELLIENKDNSIIDLLKVLSKYTQNYSIEAPIDNISPISDISKTTKNQILKYSDLCYGKELPHAN
jgi:transposase